MNTDKQIIFLGKKNYDDPLFRFYFDTLGRQLMSRNMETKNISPKNKKYISPENNLLSEINDGQLTVINFFYKDKDAIQAIKSLNKSNVSSVCFCSDIDNYSDYLNAYEVADMFVCPSLLHKKMLEYIYDLPIYHLREAVDPIFGDSVVSVVGANSINVVWFGFSESYRKSMVNLESVIIRALRENLIQSFTVISSEPLRAELPVDFKFMPYEVNNFSQQIKSFNFTVLSHTPLDLSLNTFIKSPNKACSAIVGGLIPICSDTPNYRSLLVDAGLQEYIFSSPEGLFELFKNLSQGIDMAQVTAQWSYANRLIQDQFSSSAQCDKYLEMIEALSFMNKHSKLQRSDRIKLYSAPVEEIKLRFYWRQQFLKLKNIFTF